MNSQRVTLLVLLDLSAAFDTVDHAILLKRLTTDFGIGGKALEWFSSYLSGSSQRVLFEGAVPQGSCLGMLLFVVYAPKLFEIVQDHLPNAHCFASAGCPDWRNAVRLENIERRNTVRDQAGYYPLCSYDKQTAV